MRTEGPKEHTSVNINCTAAILADLSHPSRLISPPAEIDREAPSTKDVEVQASCNEMSAMAMSLPLLLLASGKSVSFVTSARPYSIQKFWHMAGGVVYVSICGSCTPLWAFGPHKLLVI